MVMVLVDGEVGPTALDQSMLEWLRSEGLPHQVIATKHDKVKAAQREKRKRQLAAALRPRAGRRRVGERGQERRHRPAARPRAHLAQPLSGAGYGRTMGAVDRSRLAALLERERAAFAAARPRSAAAAPPTAASHLIGGVPMTWMAKWAGGFPIFLDRGRGQPRHRPRRPHLRRLRARRHRRHGRPLAARHRRRRPAAGRGPRRHHRDAPHRGRRLGGRRADGALRPAALVLRPLGHRRQPLGAAARPPGDRPTARGLLRLQLPRHRRRDVRGARPRRPHGQPRAGNVGPAVDPAATTRALEWNDLASVEAALADEQVAVLHHRAGPHQHRHRAARARASSTGCGRCATAPARCC